MRILAVDPDLHNTAWCVLDNARVYGGVLSISKSLKGDDAVCAMAESLQRLAHVPWIDVCDVYLVESQELHRMHKAAPKDILRLAQVAGAALATVSHQQPGGAIVRLVSPQEWKGQVPKEIHQARVCKRLGWEFTTKAGYCVPNEKHLEDFGVVNLSDWKHLLDAIGLALWWAKSPDPRLNPTAPGSLSSPKG